jgi:hypothetical protein
MCARCDAIRIIDGLKNAQYPGDKMSGSWEGEVPPLVLILLQKLGGRVEITEEDMYKYVNSTYVMRTWYDNERMINMYELVDIAIVVDGKVVPNGPEELSQRAIGSNQPGPGRDDGVGELRS